MLSIHLRHLTRKSKPLSPFISKLRFLLNTANHQDAIHWSADGLSIVITDIETFKQSVLDNEGDMFKTRNFTSFVRQLNLYGFRKVPSNGKTDPTTNMRFEHVHFRRERPDLMQLVHRTCLTHKRRFDHASSSIRQQLLTPSALCSTSSYPEKMSATTAKNLVFVKQKNNSKYVQLPQTPTTTTTHTSPTTQKQRKVTPLGVSLLQNLKTQTDRKYTSAIARGDLHCHKKLLLQDTFNEFKTFTNEQEEKEDDKANIQDSDRPGASHEHDYALPTSTNKEIDEKQVYQFLNQTFSLEKEVVQTLLNLNKSYCCQNAIHNGKDTTAMNHILDEKVDIQNSINHISDDAANVQHSHRFTDLKILADVSESILECSPHQSGHELNSKNNLSNILTPTPRQTLLTSSFL